MIEYMLHPELSVTCGAHCWATFPAIPFKSHSEPCLSKQASHKKLRNLLRFIQEVTKVCDVEPGFSPPGSCFSHDIVFFPSMMTSNRGQPMK